MTAPIPPPPAPDSAEFDPADDYLLTFTPVPTRARRDGWTEAKQRGFIAELRRHG